MKKKLLLISTLIATQLFSKTIDFEIVDSNPTRVSPNSANEILSFNNSVKDSVQSIVNISAKKHVNEGIENLPLQMFNDPFFKRFFGDQFGNQFKQNRIQRSLGSGVIISKDGYIKDFGTTGFAGDIFDFIMQEKNIPLPKAIKFVADCLGVKYE